MLARKQKVVLAERLMVNVVRAGGLNVQLEEEEIKSLEEPYRPMAVTGHS